LPPRKHLATLGRALAEPVVFQSSTYRRLVASGANVQVA